MPFQFRKEAIEEDLNSNFPSQGQGNPPLYYSLSEVVVPTYSINNVAEGTSLPENLQTAWDYSTGSDYQEGVGTTTIITTPGFWQIDIIYAGLIVANGSTEPASVNLNNGLADKQIWRLRNSNDSSGAISESVVEDKFVVFVDSGHSVNLKGADGRTTLTAWYRQIADLNGNLTNPLGFSFA